jgi:glycosidase
LALLFTIPGIPVLYYGDELGVAGASDPDSRRVMPDLALLSARQQRVLDVTRKLGILRASTEALRAGAHQTLVAERDTYVFMRKGVMSAHALGDGRSGSVAVVVVSKSEAPTTVVLAPDKLPQGIYTDTFDHTAFEVESAVPTPIAMAPLSFRILTRASGGGAL